MLKALGATQEEIDSFKASGLSVVDLWSTVQDVLALAKRFKTEGLSWSLITDAMALLKKLADSVQTSGSPQVLPR
jgi:hypothetical protein